MRFTGSYFRVLEKAYDAAEQVGLSFESFFFKKNFLRILVENGDSIKQLGAAFGSLFIAPIISSPPSPARSLVVSCVGAMHSGKTTFFKSACETLAGCSLFDEEKIPLKLDRYDSREQDASHFFRHLDLGHHIYPGDIRALTSFPESFSSALDISPLKTEKNSVDFIEHPSLPHIARSNTFVVIGSPDFQRDDRSYLTTFSQTAKHLLALKKERLSDCPKEESTPISRTKLAIREMEAVLSTLRRHSCASNKYRVISLSLLTQKDPLQIEAFNNFKREVLSIKSGVRLLSPGR